MTQRSILEKMCSDLTQYGCTYRIEPYSQTLMRLTDGTKALLGTFVQIRAHLLQVGGWLYAREQAKNKTTESS